MSVGGVLGTLLPLVIAIQGYSLELSGLMNSAYAIGLLIGSIACQRLIKAFGHNLVYLFSCLILAATIVLFGLCPHPLIWLGLRLVGGMLMGIIYIVIESWLHYNISNKYRALLFSCYMFVLYGSSGLAQLTLQLTSYITFEIFFYFLGGTFLLAIIPINLWKVKVRTIHLPNRKKDTILKKLWKQTPDGLIGLFCAGLIGNAFYGLVAIVLHKVYSLENVGPTMCLLTLGGMALQLPIGKLADLYNRTKVLLIVMILLFGTYTTFIFLNNTYTFWHILVLTTCGALGAVIYPISSAIVQAKLKNNDRTNAMRTMCFINIPNELQELEFMFPTG